MTVSGGRVLSMAIAGAIAGFGVFLVVDPSTRAEEMAHQGLDRGNLQDLGQTIVSAFAHMLLIGVVVGILIGVALIIAEELQSFKLLRLLRGIFLGGLVGGVVGVVGTFIAQCVFGAFAAVGHIFVPILIIGRALGWGLMGAAAGLCPGIIAQSPQRIRQGAIGGLIGGGLGGLLFDVLAFALGQGSTSRLVGFVLMGTAIGIAVALIEEFGKEYLLTMLTGTREGRSCILAKSRTLLGRDELTDIPLFGDSSVQKRHAVVVTDNGTVMLLAEPGLSVIVNNQPVSQAGLNDGDIIGVGRHRMRFGSRRATSAAPLMPLNRDLGHASLPPIAEAAPFGFTTPAASQCVVIAGPHAGAVYPLFSGAILGRDPRCDIPLVNDGNVSRQHARLVQEGGVWVVEDGNSTNGLYVNGQRVLRQTLSPGDQI